MKSLKILMIAILCSLSIQQLLAQARTKTEPLYKNNVSITTGLSLAGGLIKLTDGISDSISSYSIPAIQLNYERSLAKWFRIGGSVSYQRMGMKFSPLAYTDELGTEIVVDNATVDFNRLNIAAKGLFTYVNKEKICLYSGLRLGVTQWIVESEISDPNFDITETSGIDSGTMIAPQLILVGMNGYFTDQLGAGFEIGIGAPHIVSAGISYRF